MRTKFLEDLEEYLKHEKVNGVIEVLKVLARVICDNKNGFKRELVEIPAVEVAKGVWVHIGNTCEQLVELAIGCKDQIR